MSDDCKTCRRSNHGESCGVCSWYMGVAEHYEPVTPYAGTETRLKAEELIMDAACEYCKWPGLYDDEDQMLEERCECCPVALAVGAAFALLDGGTRRAASPTRRDDKRR